MANSTAWKMAAAFMFCAATTISSPAQVFTTLVNFEGANGNGPYLTSLVQSTDGSLYGTTFYGGVNNDGYPASGTVFKITRGGKPITLYSFCIQSNCANGGAPGAGLLKATDGNFYGTTEVGGSNFGGTVFKMTPGGTLTTLYSFCTQSNCADGSGPVAALIEAADGNFYGTTEVGGGGICMGGCGTIFRISPTGTLTTLHRFDSTDGAYPYAPLVQAIDGFFYGTTQVGGANDLGTVFKITSAGRLTTLHSFDGTDGGNPADGMIQAPDRNFYGTTAGGGANSGGTVFKITPVGALTTIYNFCGESNCEDGDAPVAGLILATDGSFYGTTAVGGGGSGADCNTAGCGTIFKITEAGALTTLHRFTGYPDDGAWPQGNLLQATNGNFYGTTFWGGDANEGTVFSLSTGLGPFVAFVRSYGRVGQTGSILGQGFTGTTSVSLNGMSASFTVVSDTFIRATVPLGATTGYVTVTTPSGTLTSNVPFHVIK
jgi:uncharacterized repeat protein (TIGR03803 family)